MLLKKYTYLMKSPQPNRYYSLNSNQRYENSQNYNNISPRYETSPNGEIKEITEIEIPGKEPYYNMSGYERPNYRYLETVDLRGRSPRTLRNERIVERSLNPQNYRLRQANNFNQRNTHNYSLSNNCYKVPMQYQQTTDDDYDYKEIIETTEKKTVKRSYVNPEFSYDNSNNINLYNSEGVNNVCYPSTQPSRFDDNLCEFEYNDNVNDNGVCQCIGCPCQNLNQPNYHIVRQQGIQEDIIEVPKIIYEERTKLVPKTIYKKVVQNIPITKMVEVKEIVPVEEKCHIVKRYPVCIETVEPCTNNCTKRIMSPVRINCRPSRSPNLYRKYNIC